jgi:hypothetical protein
MSKGGGYVRERERERGGQRELASEGADFRKELVLARGGT